MILSKDRYAHSRLMLKDPSAEIEMYSKVIPTPEGFTKFAPKRQWEYLAGRAAAHEALEVLGVEGFYQTKKKSGEPSWPEGFKGSISHSHGLVESIVTNDEKISYVGLDLEKVISEKQLSLSDKIFCPGSFESLKEKTKLSDVKLFTLGFSAKECLYKAIFAEVGEYFGFQKASVVELTDKTIKLEINEDLSDTIKKDLAWKQVMTLN